MSYLLTNASALTALQNLNMTQNELSTTQSQLSTGLSIQNASDNASYWSIAQTMTSDNSSLGTVGSALSVSSSLLSTVNSAVNQALSMVNNIKQDLLEAQNPPTGTTLTQIQSDIVAQQKDLAALANSASFNGQNWLNGTVNGASSATVTGGTVNLVGSYTDSQGVGSISIAMGQVNLFTGGTTATAASGGLLASAQNGATNASTTGISSWQILGATQASSTVAASAISSAIYVSSTTPSSDMSNMLAAVTTIYSNLETAASTIGAAQDQVSTQQTFVATMQTNLTNGIASLVDANMNQVSTRLQALQTQQQLGVQSLSIANQSSQMILKLFQ